MPDNFAQDPAAEGASEFNSSDATGAASSDASANPLDGPGTDAELDRELADLNAAISKEAELLADLQRLQAEFVNYKNRVERDRDLARNSAIAEVLRAFLPALDDLTRAESHGDLEGSPFAAVVTKIRAAGDKFGLKAFGEKGDKFNPELHDALVQLPNPEVTENTVGDVIEQGFTLGDRVIRPAKVAVFIPAEG
jgi:molecular chaperone GrpE